MIQINGPIRKQLHPQPGVWKSQTQLSRLQRELGETPNQSAKLNSLWWKGRFVTSDMRSWETFSAFVFGVFGSPFPGGIQLSWKGTTLRPPCWEDAQAVTSFPVTSSILTTPNTHTFSPSCPLRLRVRCPQVYSTSLLGSPIPQASRC